MKLNRRQYTIRNIPRSVDRILRERAAEKRVSLNTMLLQTLEREAGVGAPPRAYDDLDKLIGSWVADPEVDKALSEQRSVDPRDWR